MHKYLIIFSLTICSCSSSLENMLLGEEVYLQESEAMGSIILGTKEFKDVEFWIVSVDQIEQARKYSSLTYLGSDSSFHFFRVWNKVVKSGEINFFALDHSVCLVQSMHMINDEVDTPSDYWREATIKDRKCIVAAR